MMKVGGRLAVFSLTCSREEAEDGGRDRDTVGQQMKARVKK